MTFNCFLLIFLGGGDFLLGTANEYSTVQFSVEAVQFSVESLSVVQFSVETII